MKSKNTRSFEVNNEQFQFNLQTFTKLFDEYRRKHGLKVGDLEAALAENLSVTSDAVHNWRSGYNGPGDIEMIQKIAKELNVVDWRILLKTRGEKSVSELSIKQIESVKKIYDSIMDFLIWFDETDGITGTLWYEFVRNGVEPRKIRNELYSLAEDRVRSIQHVYEKEYLYLKNTDIYIELGNYLYEKIYNIYDGKLDYAYRFEAGVEKIDGTRDTVTTEEDYMKYLEMLNSIIDKYI